MRSQPGRGSGVTRLRLTTDRTNSRYVVETGMKESDESSRGVADDPDVPPVRFGETLYTADGRPVGTVRGIDEDGVFVTVREGAEALSVEHARSGHEFGEAELVWRCTNCGEMGEIAEGLPETCPNCGVEREELMYWTED